MLSDKRRGWSSVWLHEAVGLEDKSLSGWGAGSIFIANKYLKKLVGGDQNIVHNGDRRRAFRVRYDTMRDSRLNWGGDGFVQSEGG